MKVRWLLIALGTSLALNLALVGFLVGQAAGAPSFLRAPPAGFDPTVGLGRLLRFLPEDRRAEVLAGAARGDIREALATVRRTQRVLHRQLGQEPLDEQALAAALGRFREEFAASQAASHAAFVAVAARLTPAERQRFVARMNKGPRARRGDRPGRGEGQRERRRDRPAAERPAPGPQPQEP